VAIERAAPPLKGIASGEHLYFVHSYYVEPFEPSCVIGVTEYHSRFAAICGRGNLVGVQFHPEKSQATGLRLLKNFAEMR
jgi:glutamine amidotransferase